MNRIIYLLLEFAEAQVVKSSTVRWIKKIKLARLHSSTFCFIWLAALSFISLKRNATNFYTFARVTAIAFTHLRLDLVPIYRLIWRFCMQNEHFNSEFSHSHDLI
jgi:hypothetical protein